MKKTLFALLLAGNATAWAAPPAPIKVELAPTVGNSARGSLTFTEQAGGVGVQGQVENLSPGNHGFHVHEHGDCSGSGEKAGEHYNPHTKPHGAPSPDHHIGDLGNLVADNNGRAKVSAKVEGVTLTALKGRAVIVHEKADDLQSQPAGNAGGRIACGVIK